MKKFKFKLEPLLKIRKLKEDQCKMLIGQVQARINQLHEYKQGELAGIESAYKAQEDGLEQGMSGQEAQFHPYFVSAKKARIKLIDNEVSELQDKLKDMFKELNKLRADVKVIEKMKEKEIKSYKKEYTKKQFATIEEQVQNWKQTLK
ncbi:MAG: hypothetical protein CME62_14530 [Halobacteriovoraceae bacterium]|nr:hypothetical protein [Halobacteriovoraceae bacterium]|tara:strand:- start:2203 stop:2646 length:444 start_codon:yes stop_codon:yes gene_type:complete